MEMYVGQLQDAETLIRKLQEQINFVSAFSNHLIQNVDNDPASLVQLYETVKLRLDLLQLFSERILNDSAFVMNSVDEKLKDKIKESSLWSENVIGWRSVVSTRALFLGLTKTDNPVSDQLAADTNDFLDSLAELDGDKWICGDNNGESLSGPTGCAICFGVGLLAHCERCGRAYHLDCHLPRIDSISLTSNWACCLCADDEVTSTTHVDKPSDSGFSHNDYLVGCRILMGLLVHAEAVHFTASVCPACSAPLLSPSRSMPHCPAGHLYHRLSELRLRLEESAASLSNGYSYSTSSPDSDNSQSRFTSLGDWLVEVDKFWSDAAKETEFRVSKVLPKYGEYFAAFLSILKKDEK
ncbi:unnamed protein product [Heterobilharzia americana]|nr:unnamed protein product [Heterobilharzia americana]